MGRRRLFVVCYDVKFRKASTDFAIVAHRFSVKSFGELRIECTCDGLVRVEVTQSSKIEGILELNLESGA